MMDEMAKVIIILGIVLVIVGLVMLFAQKLPFLGKLPGDILIKKENFTFYFPLATSIIISIIISLILYLIGKFR
jgi:thiosulfate reductase cytochrome b subunit